MLSFHFLLCLKHQYYSAEYELKAGVRGSLTLADCYVEICDFKTCDSLYEMWLQKEPTWGWGWIGWSDCYWLFLRKYKPDFKKAHSILERGLAIEGINHKNDMIDRLNSLKREMEINQTYEPT